MRSARSSASSSAIALLLFALFLARLARRARMGVDAHAATRCRAELRLAPDASSRIRMVRVSSAGRRRCCFRSCRPCTRCGCSAACASDTDRSWMHLPRRPRRAAAVRDRARPQRGARESRCRRVGTVGGLCVAYYCLQFVRARSARGCSFVLALSALTAATLAWNPIRA